MTTPARTHARPHTHKHIHTGARAHTHGHAHACTHRRQPSTAPAFPLRATRCPRRSPGLGCLRQLATCFARRRCGVARVPVAWILRVGGTARWRAIQRRTGVGGVRYRGSYRHCRRISARLRTQAHLQGLRLSMNDTVDNLLQVGHRNRRVAICKLCDRVLCLPGSQSLRRNGAPKLGGWRGGCVGAWVTTGAPR